MFFLKDRVQNCSLRNLNFQTLQRIYIVVWIQRNKFNQYDIYIHVNGGSSSGSTKCKNVRLPETFPDVLFVDLNSTRQHFWWLTHRTERKRQITHTDTTTPLIRTRNVETRSTIGKLQHSYSGRHICARVILDDDSHERIKMMAVTRTKLFYGINWLFDKLAIARWSNHWSSVSMA